MKFLGIALLLTGLVICAAAFAGHPAAYSSAAVCFFAAAAVLNRTNEPALHKPPRTGR